MVAIRLLFKPPATPPYLLLLFYTACALAAFADLLADILAHTSPGSAGILADILRIAVPLVSLWIGGTYPLDRVLPCPNVAREKDVRNLHTRSAEYNDGFVPHLQVPSSDLTMPEDSVSLWSWITVSHVEPLFRIASVKTVDEADVWSLSPFFMHKNLFTKYLAYMEK